MRARDLFTIARRHDAEPLAREHIDALLEDVESQAVTTAFTPDLPAFLRSGVFHSCGAGPALPTWPDPP